MKKILVAAATAVMTVAPAAAVHADTGGGYGGNGTNTAISATQNQAYSTGSSTNSGTDASVEQYTNKTVSYEALYYVKYDASETAYLSADWSQWNNTHNQENAHNNTASYFHNMMGGNWGHEE